MYRLGVRIGCHENDECEYKNRVLLRSDFFEMIQWWYMLNFVQLQISEQIPGEINSIVAGYKRGNWGPWWWLPGRQIKVSHRIPVGISVSGKHSFALHISIEVCWEQGCASGLMKDAGSTAKVVTTNYLLLLMLQQQLHTLFIYPPGKHYPHASWKGDPWAEGLVL